MPVTISVANHKANAISDDLSGLTSAEILTKACKPQYNASKGGGVLASSLRLTTSTTRSFYVNAHAKILRAMFVAHDGKKGLVVEREKMVAEVGEFARAMVGEIDKNVVDPTLREWALPDFSTTAECDRTISSVLIMATLKSYFHYESYKTGCGIPRVTLELGEKQDWEKLLQRAEKFKEYGLECIAWHHMLVPVLSRFVRTFDEPEAPSTVDFWSLVADHRRGSGRDEYSGWLGKRVLRVESVGTVDGAGSDAGTTAVSPVPPEILSANKDVDS
ncbi:hypothetical protein MKEN_00291200 [Mycena kentingensis (nom. inval.)]|nr:hypothetical protein MKEN_00291200 [Mycena kentingensis (nom. inval.)]